MTSGEGEFPLGPPVDATPAQRPGPVTLAGSHGRIERLAPHHGTELWEALHGHDKLWTYLPAGPFENVVAFSYWLGECIAQDSPYFYAITNGTGKAVGMSALMEVRPAMRVIEVGHILYSPALQKTPLAAEAQYLLARYAFETLGYRRYEWKCNALNAPSRRAALRYGFRFEGIFRQHMIVKGRTRDTAWFSILDSEWPARREAFERWLAADNFDAQGQQKMSLASLNEGER